MKVTQFESMNQFSIEDGDNRYLQSYKSLVVMAPCKGKVYGFGENWDYSRTTAKYVARYTGYTTQEIREGIKSGKFATFTNQEAKDLSGLTVRK